MNTRNQHDSAPGERKQEDGSGWHVQLDVTYVKVPCLWMLVRLLKTK